MILTKILIPIFLFFFLFACKKKEENFTVTPIAVSELQAEEGEELSADIATTFINSKDAFGQQAVNMPASASGDFTTGNSFFRLAWVTSPSSTTARDGLGPLLNANSCGACHTLDGRGRPPIEGETQMNSMLIRISATGVGPHGEPIPIPNYGGQLNDKAIFSALPEGKVSISYTEKTGKYADNTAYSLRVPTYVFDGLNFGSMPSGTLISPRVAPQMPGLGLLEALDDVTLLNFADPSDANNDGISGKVNRVWNAQTSTQSIGRFGWKANQPNLFQQTAGAFLGDMGITSSLFPNENLTGITKQMYDSLSNGGTPEILDSTLKKVVFYCQTLTVPARRNWKDKEVLEGKVLFSKSGCANCHVPKMSTSSIAEISEFRNLVIRPYTDLLLHDMGEELADNRPDFEANGQEWRTPPLWGIGLIKTVNNHTFFLHDGRARNIEEAILWHGGEAEKSKNSFKNLAKLDRDKILKFLNSL